MSLENRQARFSLGTLKTYSTVLRTDTIQALHCKEQQLILSYSAEKELKGDRMSSKLSFQEQYSAKHRPASVSAEPRIQPCESGHPQGQAAATATQASKNRFWLQPLSSGCSLLNLGLLM